MSGLKMLSYNLRLLTQRNSISNIIEQILKSGFDIICFQECSMANRKILEEALASSYPYRVNKATAKGFQVELCCSGLFIASRFPFLEVKFGGFLEDFVTRGVLGVLISIPTVNFKLWILTTHLHCNFVQCSWDLRKKQIVNMKDFVEKCINTSKGAAILCGDLDADGPILRKREEYANFISIIGGKNICYQEYNTHEEKDNSDHMIWSDHSPPAISMPTSDLHIEGMNFVIAFDIIEPMMKSIQFESTFL